MTKKIIQSYVYHKEKRYFVSTMERESSAMSGDRCNETIVWEWPDGEKERGKMIFQREDYIFSINAHFKICNDIFLKGKLV